MNRRSFLKGIAGAVTTIPFVGTKIATSIAAPLKINHIATPNFTALQWDQKFYNAYRSKTLAFLKAKQDFEFYDGDRWDDSDQSALDNESPNQVTES